MSFVVLGFAMFFSIGVRSADVVDAQASPAYTMLADSTPSENQMRAFTMAEYRQILTQVDWPLRIEGCSADPTTPYKTLPWIASTAYGLRFTPYPAFDGNNFHLSGNCDTPIIPNQGPSPYGPMLTDGGTGVGAWARNSALGNWAFPGGGAALTGTPVIAETSVKLNECDSLGIGGIRAPKIWSHDSVLRESTGIYIDNAESLFDANNQSTVYDNVIARYRSIGGSIDLESQGTILVRNEFTISNQAMLDRINNNVNRIRLRLVADDFYNVYINGVRVAVGPIATSGSNPGSSTNLDLSAFRNLFVVGTNVIAIQAVDKAIWVDYIAFPSIGFGMCYTLVLEENAPPGPSLAASCGGVTFNPDPFGAGQPFTLRATVSNSSTGTPPPSLSGSANPMFITITGPGSSYNSGNIDYGSIASGASYAHTVSGLTVTAGGTYTVTYGIRGVKEDCTRVFTVSAAPVAKPYIEAFGGDVRVGDVGFSGVCDRLLGHIRTYNKNGGVDGGSGSQFATIAGGDISGFGSAVLRATSPARVMGLTFSNTTSAPMGGQFSNTCLAGSRVRYNNPGNTGFRSITLTRSGGKYVYNLDRTPDERALVGVNEVVQSDVYFTSEVPGYSRLPVPPVWFNNGDTLYLQNGGDYRGVNKYLFVDGDVYIRDNIVYRGTGSGPYGFGGSGWASFAAVPGLRVVASGNMYIDNDVTRLDGVFVSLGTLYTCANNDEASELPLASLPNTCNRQLVINGGIAAHEVKLMRVFGNVENANSSENPFTGARDCGGESASVCAGEVILFGPEVFLQSLRPDSEKDLFNVKYDYITALPPVL